jgi:ABC-type ATPase involved in cell division
VIKEELIQRSPVRIFEKSIHGGLRPGEMGIIASPSGIGKTAVLVQIALDKLLQGKKVIHVSFTQHIDYILAWYEDIFDEFIKRKNLDHAQDVKNDLVKDRILLNFSQDGVTGSQILRSLRAIIVDGGVNAGTIIIDGFDFSRISREQMEEVKAQIKELGISIWYSCTLKGKEPYYDKNGIPLLVKDFLDLIDVIIVLEPRADHIELAASKDRDTVNLEHLALKLDPKTLLILEE